MPFEWPICPAGYCADKRAPDPPRKRRYQHPLIPRQMLEETVRGEERGGTYIVPRTAEMRSLVLFGWPHSGQEPLACTFVNAIAVSPDSDGMLEFCDRFGLLFRDGDDRLSRCHEAANDFLYAQGVLPHLGLAEFVRRYPGPILEVLRAGGTRVRRPPRTLLQFMWVEFYRVVAAAREFRVCNLCGKMFMSGLRATPTTDPMEPHYCHQPCTSAAYDRSSKGIALQEERAAQWERWKPGGLEDEKRRAERELATPTR
jgi:hypothetical protein